MVKKLCVAEFRDAFGCVTISEYFYDLISLTLQIVAISAKIIHVCNFIQADSRMKICFYTTAVAATQNDLVSPFPWEERCDHSLTTFTCRDT